VLARAIGTTAELFSVLPLRVAVRVGGALGIGAYRVLGRDRRRALEHLAVAFPDVEPDARVRLARETFRNAGRSFAELAQWGRIQRRLGELITVEGLDHVHRGLALGRGLIAITGHVGNWELLAATIAQLGYPLTVVARRVNDDRFDHLISSFRARTGVRTIRRDGARALLQITPCLRAGGILALLVDQDTRGPGVFVPFFGRPARTSPGAAILALRTRAPVVTAFIERRAHGHHIRIDPLDGCNAVPDHRPSIEELTVRLTGAVERQIRRSPSEWVWWHRRWRTQATAGVCLERSA
jgi:KDO2-lipid IV(A) lauroyltransferase